MLFYLIKPAVRPFCLGIGKTGEEEQYKTPISFWPLDCQKLIGVDISSDVVGVTGLEPATSRPPAVRATSCATPRRRDRRAGFRKRDYFAYSSLRSFPPIQFRKNLLKQDLAKLFKYRGNYIAKSPSDDGLFARPASGTQFTSATCAKWVLSRPGHGPVRIVELPNKLY
jgi:hypothetical protein